MDQFKDQVKKSLSRDFLLSARLKINARQAREYIVAYLLLSIDAGFET